MLRTPEHAVESDAYGRPERVKEDWITVCEDIARAVVHQRRGTVYRPQRGVPWFCYRV